MRLFFTAGCVLPALILFMLHAVPQTLQAHINIKQDCAGYISIGGDSTNPQPLFLPNLLRLRLQNLAGVGDETVLCLRNGATNLFDSNFDAYKLPGSALYIATRIETGVDLSINCLAPWGSNSPVSPVTFFVNASGPYQLAFTQMDSFIDEINVFLRDNYFNEVTLIKKDTLYNFEVTPDIMSQGLYRFEILFTENIITRDLPPQQCQCNVLEVYPNPAINGEVYVKMKNMQEQEVQIEISSYTGQTAFKANISGQLLHGGYKVPAKLPQGMYILSVKANNEVQQQKLIVY